MGCISSANSPKHTTLTTRNANIGARVIRNPAWKPAWGDEDIHPPHNCGGTILGWTTRPSSGEVVAVGHADDSMMEFPDLAWVRWDDGDEGGYRIGFADEFWLALAANPRKPPLTAVNIYMGARVVKNPAWNRAWGCEDIHPPAEGGGTVIGWTNMDSPPVVVGDVEATMMGDEGLANVRWDGDDAGCMYRIGFGDEFWLALAALQPPLTALNVFMGARVVKNPEWNPAWGCEDIHPPAEGGGTVIGWTSMDSPPVAVGDVDALMMGDAGLANVRWDGNDDGLMYRIGFGDEFWLALVSAAATPAPPPLTAVNVCMGARVVKNPAWNPAWGCEDIHPPAEGGGTVIGWTTMDSPPVAVGDVEATMMGDEGLANVRWDGDDAGCMYRIGFGDEFWLALVSAENNMPAGNNNSNNAF